MNARNLRIATLQKRAVERHEELKDGSEDWGIDALALAAAGPVGYITHLLTTQRRGFDVKDDEIYDEIADAIIYLALLCEEMGGDLAEVLIRKFNENSKHEGVDIYLDDAQD